MRTVRACRRARHLWVPSSASLRVLTHQESPSHGGRGQQRRLIQRRLAHFLVPPFVPPGHPCGHRCRSRSASHAMKHRLGWKVMTGLQSPPVLGIDHEWSVYWSAGVSGGMFASGVPGRRVWCSGWLVTVE
jgi:hypothetical protein